MCAQQFIWRTHHQSAEVSAQWFTAHISHMSHYETHRERSERPAVQATSWSISVRASAVTHPHPHGSVCSVWQQQHQRLFSKLQTPPQDCTICKSIMKFVCKVLLKFFMVACFQLVIQVALLKLMFFSDFVACRFAWHKQNGDLP